MHPTDSANDNQAKVNDPDFCPSNAGRQASGTPPVKSLGSRNRGASGQFDSSARLALGAENRGHAIIVAPEAVSGFCLQYLIHTNKSDRPNQRCQFTSSGHTPICCPMRTSWLDRDLLVPHPAPELRSKLYADTIMASSGSELVQQSVINAAPRD